MNEEIIDLQSRMAFQDGLLEHLNQVVTDQQQQIDRLERAIAVLRSQLESLHTTQVMGHNNEPPPPHY